MQIHLFSAPGEPFLVDILSAARAVLEGVTEPLVVYLPAAAQDRHFVRETKSAFRGLAEVRAAKPEVHTRAAICRLLDEANLLYIPGGNTYLAAHRLHAAGLMQDITQRIRDGLPLVAFSAGSVLCGADILTSNDANECDCVNFTGMDCLPYNLNVHYPIQDGEERRVRDARLMAYTNKHRRAVLALEDGAYLRASADRIEVIRGTVWKFQNQRKERFIESH